MLDWPVDVFKRFRETLSENRSLILIVEAREVRLLNRHLKLIIVRECWRMIPFVCVEIFIKFKVLVVSDERLRIIEVDLFD